MDDFDELILEEELFAPPSEIVDYSLELLANIIYYIACVLHKNKWLLNHRSEWYSKKILNINFCFWWYSSVFGWNKITPELVRIAWGLTCYHHAVSLWTYVVAYWFSLLLALENQLTLREVSFLILLRNHLVKHHVTISLSRDLPQSSMQDMCRQVQIAM